jgi:hypothetical protein
MGYIKTREAIQEILAIIVCRDGGSVGFCWLILNTINNFESLEVSMSYNLFISHSWTYSDQYEQLLRLLNQDSYFSYKNYSVPKHDPIHNSPSQAQLKEAIRSQMANASSVLILAGVYATYSKWINIEIDLAKNGFLTPKRVIAIEPWGAERTSQVVKDAADVIVKWQTSSIVKAIRGY